MYKHKVISLKGMKIDKLEETLNSLAESGWQESLAVGKDNRALILVKEVNSCKEE